MFKNLGPLAVITAMTTLLPLAAQAQMTGSDNAGNYTSTTGYAGQNMGTGFGPFTVTSNNNNGPIYAGTFIGSSGSAGYNIDTNGNSFGIYANGDPTATVTITRSFTTALQNPGDQFNVQLRTDFSNSSTGQTFTFSIGPETLTLTSSGYSVTGGNVVSNLSQSDYILNTSFIVGPANAYNFTVQGNNPNTDLAVATGTLAGPVGQFSVSGTNLPNNQYFNNLSITNEPAAAPEPSSVASMLIGVLALGGVIAVRRRRQAA